ncbi:hypothetical protein Q3G72_005750 [Acer saccharum]|nr:hypothetical protein Q3G72_005750 [Acer saccharum]
MLSVQCFKWVCLLLQSNVVLLLHPSPPALLFMVSSVSAWGVGYSYRTLVYGTTITSPDGRISYCSCNGDQQPPQTPTPIKNPPSHGKKNPPSPYPHTPGSKNQPPSIFQLPPLPFLNSGPNGRLIKWRDYPVAHFAWRLSLMRLFKLWVLQVNIVVCQQSARLNSGGDRQTRTYTTDYSSSA